MADDGDAEGAGIARTRSRRNHVSKNSRDSVLEKYKAARGGQLKNKFEVEEIQNVYDVVEESEYSRKVQDRQKDDWIVDDGTGEYYEDGREIFDDDLHDDEMETGGGRSRKKTKSKKEKEVEKFEKNQYKAGFQDLRNMFSSMPVKRKVTDTDGASSSKASEDELLGSLLKELHGVKKPKVSANGDSGFGDVQQIRSPVTGAGPSGRFTKRDTVEIKKPKFNSLGVKKFSDPSPKTKFKPNVVKAEPDDNLPVRNYIDDDDEPLHFESNCMDDNDDFRSCSPDPCEPNKISHPAKNGEDKNANKQPVGAKANAVTDVKANLSTNTSDKKLDVNREGKKSKLPKYDFEESAGDIIGMDEEIDDAMSALMMEDNENSDQKLNFFLLDIHEEPRNPGCLYLFGKVQESVGHYASCCVVVKNLMRCVYLLPKENDSPEDDSNCDAILEEFDDVISPKYHISSFKSRPVVKKYCFDVPNVPKSSAYLEVRYAGTQQPLPADLKGEAFSKVFGTSITLMETFLLEMKLKGPSWLQISNPSKIESAQHQSWCKFEFTTDVRSIKLHPEGTNMPIPPVVLVSLNVLSVNNATTKKDDIVFIGVAVNRKFHLQSSPATNSKYHESYCLINKPSGEVWPLDVDKVTNKRVTKMDSERAMLGCFLAKLQQIDADVFLGHDINFELLLLHLMEYKVPHWSRIGRLKRSTNITTKGSKGIDFRAALAGRLLCDIKISAMELIRARSYDLPSLATQILGKKEDEVGNFTGPEMKQLFDSSQGLRCFTSWGMNHCALNMQLVNELQVMPLALQITTIAGNTLSRTLLGGRSERNEFLLLHAFHSKGYIVPDKREKQPWKKGSQVKKEEEPEADGEEGDAKSGDADKKGASYIGGLVLAPKRGFYDNFIVLMDFNSLYPSIIQEYNICFTTRVDLEGSEAEEKDRGILPEEIRKLVESRKQVKNLMKSENVSQDLMRQYDIRQKALKLTANSMYGCLGFRNSRFFAKELAALITGKGREILLKTKDAVEKMGFEVIYGDTDSIMINSNTQDIQKVYPIGNKIKAEINKMYKLLELEVDGIFRFLLLLKKKKYAALIYNAKSNGESETVLEMKGLDMVRRDWAPVAGNTARLILNEIMTEQSLDDKIFKICKILNEVATKLKEGNIALRELLITKQLTKNPTEYKSAQGLHHVQVALKMNQKGNLAKKFRNGDTVSYLFCTDGNPHHLSELPQVETDETAVKEENTTEVALKPDPLYYLSQQIHPVVSRICDPIPGLDPARIAESLGMDASSYKKRRYYEENDEDKSLGEQTEAEKYRDCEKFSFQCCNAQCASEIVFENFFKDLIPDVSSNFLKCSTCKESQPIPYMSNKLVLFMRKFTEKYYKNVYICEDPSCDNTERAIPFKLHRGYPLCSCKRGYMFKEYNDAQLYKQLTYLEFCFDLDKQKENATEIKKAEIEVIMKVDKYTAAMSTLKSEISKILLQSAYSEIKLSTLFQDLYPQQKRRVNRDT